MSDAYLAVNVQPGDSLLKQQCQVSAADSIGTADWQRPAHGIPNSVVHVRVGVVLSQQMFDSINSLSHLNTGSNNKHWSP